MSRPGQEIPLRPLRTNSVSSRDDIDEKKLGCLHSKPIRSPRRYEKSQGHQPVALLRVLFYRAHAVMVCFRRRQP